DMAVGSPVDDPGDGALATEDGLVAGRVGGGGRSAGDSGQVGPRPWVADPDREVLDVPAAGPVDHPGGQALAGQVGQVSGRVSGGGRSAGDRGQIGPRPGVADPDREFLDMPGGGPVDDPAGRTLAIEMGFVSGRVTGGGGSAGESG